MYVIRIELPNFIQIKPSRHCNDVISIFQDGGHGVANLVPVAGLMTAVVSEGQSLLADRISMLYLNPPLDYYYLYFRYRRTDVLHLEILLDVSF